MAINVVSVQQYNGGLLLIQCYNHRGIQLNAMKRFALGAYVPT